MIPMRDSASAFRPLFFERSKKRGEKKTTQSEIPRMVDSREASLLSSRPGQTPEERGSAATPLYFYETALRMA